VLPERIELAGNVRKRKKNKSFGRSYSTFVYHLCGPDVQGFNRMGKAIRQRSPGSFVGFFMPQL
jgi:hypothetical protein